MPKTPLNPSPLSILAQEFVEISIQASLETEYGTGNIEVDREILRVKDNPHSWLVELAIELTGISGEKLPSYVGMVRMHGYYEVHNNYPHDPERLIRVTGASMLYGAAREMIANLTARGPNGMLTLPSVSFYEQVGPKKKVTKKAVKKLAKAK